MNILSMLSIILYTCFFIGAMKIVTAERKSILNISAFAVLLSLGWWSFCNSFFYAAATVENAWFWHRLSSIGWCSFAALTAYYFFALTDRHGKRFVLWKTVLFFAPAVVLICVNLFGKTTALAQSIVPAQNGWGLTYTNSVNSFWLWAYLLYVAVYFGVAFYSLYKWSKTTEHKMKKRMAIAFIIIDVITILFGVVTDVIFPLTQPIIPALASIGTVLFAIGYFGIIYRYDVFNINLVISAEDILKTSNNLIFVMDENLEILKCNTAAEVLLRYSKSELIGMHFDSLTVAADDRTKLFTTEDTENIEIQIHCKDGEVRDVLFSASAARDKQQSYICTIVSCQDITKRKQFRKELEKEQEKYKKLAEDYQRLANYDSLTELPNRRYLYDELSCYEKRYHEEKKDFAVLFMDLDNFKNANDLYGHKAGDKLLKETANKLKACVDSGEFLSRLSGDEFMLIMPYISPNDIERKIQKINSEFSHSISLNGTSYQIHISIGFGVFSEVEDTNKLIHIADEAMYQNKRPRQ